MRLTDRRAIVCVFGGGLASFFCGCGVIGPSPWNECGAELQECCGPACCKIDARLIPAGSYEVFVLADPSNAVVELSVTNNLLVKSDPLWIP